MSKFNKTTTKANVTSPVATEAVPTGLTFEGGDGHARDTKSELFLLAVSNMVGEATFYEGAGERDNRYAELVRRAAVADPDWTGRFLAWLRGEGNLRSASLVGALEAAKQMAASGVPGSRAIVASVLQRPDEPGEALAYWTSTYGRAIPKPVKRGIADAVRRLYNERALLKYDTASKGFRFGDVLELVHASPDPAKPWQGDLFGYAIDRRHGHDEQLPTSLTTVAANAELRANPDPRAWLGAATLQAAGMTWEDALSGVGSKVDKAELWTALIPSMGYMALLRNLRNFDQAEVPDSVAAMVAARLADPEQVARSRQLPMRFLSAYRTAPSLRWGHALETALGHSLANVPKLRDRTLILVDRSGSMWDRLSARSDLTRADAAAIFGTALAHRCEHADLIEFGTNSARIAFDVHGSVLRELDRFGNLGGTYTAEAVRRWYDRHNRVVIVTDEQAHYDHGIGGLIPSHVPLYTWNLAGYRYGHAPSGTSNRHTFGGLSDAAFRMVPLIEAGQNGTWPF